MADLGSLQELYAWMRKENVLYARCGELELRLEAVVPAPPTVAVEVEPSPAELARRDLADLLYSSGIDPASLNLPGSS